jgi:hypothetical protein
MSEELNLDIYIESISTPGHRKLRDAIGLASDQDQITWLTEGGRRIAAIVPAGVAERHEQDIEGVLSTPAGEPGDDEARQAAISYLRSVCAGCRGGHHKICTRYRGAHKTCECADGAHRVYELEVAARLPGAGKRSCPDGAPCPLGCQGGSSSDTYKTGCSRVAGGTPLPGVYPDDKWPDPVIQAEFDNDGVL